MLTDADEEGFSVSRNLSLQIGAVGYLSTNLRVVGTIVCLETSCINDIIYFLKF